ncbi:DUF6783 domain-containing protein [Hungatella hathewayi]|uniref:DUF6783 domain-containing protein n=1 Tax=Hungatella hathewayi TaxID=154046 RepID=UPI00356AE333
MQRCTRACLKIHSRHLYAPLRGILSPNSVSVAHYASFIGAQSPTKCDAQLTESNFQTLSSPACMAGIFVKEEEDGNTGNGRQRQRKIGLCRAGDCQTG